MAKSKADPAKTRRVNAELRKLQGIFKELDDDKKDMADGLIQRAAFMRVELEDLEVDLTVNGWTDMFQQSDKQTPYMRQRPEGQSYVALSKTYQSCIKQLIAIMPSQADSDAAKELMDFVKKVK